MYYVNGKKYTSFHEALKEAIDSGCFVIETENMLIYITINDIINYYKNNT